MMAHLRSFRLGWESQIIASTLLYRFSFLAEPVQVADDIGIDYFCTLFETKLKSKNAELIPKDSFAIQIKSKGDNNTIELTGYLPYLEGLELPFFIGIVDRDEIKFNRLFGRIPNQFICFQRYS